jgi:hypothetical protein
MQQVVLHFLNVTTVGTSLRKALQDMKEEGYVDVQNMYKQPGRIKCAMQGVVRHYVIAYDIFSKECIMHGWLSARIMQLPFHMLIVNNFWILKMSIVQYSRDISKNEKTTTQ